ncbi:MAG: complex I NDUFA9 subunit family protein [Rubrivivax sp.]|nr:complex I NDUFA9 subunit family protein [Rubrivivax sp.]
MNPDRILVLGGTGFVGRALCARLASRWPGARIVVPSRRPPAAGALRVLPTVSLVPADVHDAATLSRLLQGADAVVNLVAILHGSAAEFERVHVQLPQRLAEACRAAGVARLLHVSALGVGPDAPSNYLRSKTAGEAVLSAAGLGLTLLRPSVIFGAEDRFLNLFAALLRLAPVMPLAGASARFQPVWVQDVAEAGVRCLDRGVTGVLECAGPEVFTLAELVRLAGRWSGHERAVWPLPDALARLQAAVLEAAPGPTLMSRDNLDSMRVPNVATPGARGLGALGIEPTALGQVMPAVLARRGPRSHLDGLRGSR